MNARDTLRALADGKTIIGSNGYLWKLDEYDDLIQKKPEKKFWEHSQLVFNGDCEIHTDYLLDFEQALGEMLIGKTVMYENCEEYAYRFRNGRFESSCSDDEFTKWEMCEVGSVMQKSKWKVVE